MKSNRSNRCHPSFPAAIKTIETKAAFMRVIGSSLFAMALITGAAFNVETAYAEGTLNSDSCTAYLEQPEYLGTRPRLSSEQRAKVDRLMKIAELHASVGRVVEPLGSSALDAYAIALEIDPGITEAREGVAKAIRTCRIDVENLIENGELEIAGDIVHHCLQIKPSDPILRALNRSLLGLRTSSSSNQESTNQWWSGRVATGIN